MSNRRRRTSARDARASTRSHGGLSRQARIWLGTLSTVLGLATGMFTLRDEIFPAEAGTAEALPIYRQKVGRICDDVNDADRARAREQLSMDRRLRRATTPIQRRNALLDPVRHEAARSGRALAALGALDPPKAVAARHRSTEASWNRNLDRIRAYAEQLDGASDDRQVMAAVRGLSRQRSAIARDGVRVISGLQRLGKESCRIAPAISTRTITLPPLRAESAGRTVVTRELRRGATGGRSGGGANPSSVTGGGGEASAVRGEGTGQASVATPRANTPGAAEPSASTPSVNTPSAGAPNLVAPGADPVQPGVNTPGAAPPSGGGSAPSSGGGGSGSAAEGGGGGE